MTRLAPPRPGPADGLVCLDLDGAIDHRLPDGAPQIATSTGPTAATPTASAGVR